MPSYRPLSVFDRGGCRAVDRSDDVLTFVRSRAGVVTTSSRTAPGPNVRTRRFESTKVLVTGGTDVDGASQVWPRPSSLWLGAAQLFIIQNRFSQCYHNS